MLFKRDKHECKIKLIFLTSLKKRNKSIRKSLRSYTIKSKILTSISSNTTKKLKDSVKKKRI